MCPTVPAPAGCSWTHWLIDWWRNIQARVWLRSLAKIAGRSFWPDEARNTPSTGDAGLTSAKGKPIGKPLEIQATGQQWIWRYDYPNGAFSYYKLVVPVDTAVKLKLVSTDVVHTWNVGDLAGKADAVPGKIHNIYFRADEEGSFGDESATLSGQAYAQMRTEVEVVSSDDYKAFVQQQKKEIDSAQEHVVELLENGEVP